MRFINTTSRIQVVKTGVLPAESLENYKIFTIDEVKKKKERTKQLMEIIEKNTPSTHRDKILALCREYSEIFVLQEDKLTVNNFYEQKFRMKDENPVYTKNYRTPYTQRCEIDKQVDNLLKNDLIEPSAAEFNSPVLLVPKKQDGQSEEKKWRLCIDYRLVNKKLIADKYPLPRIEDILDSLGRARHFSVIDLFSGFHQIPIQKESRDITSFSTNKGSFRWKVVPFGLSVSPNSFSRMMAIAFSGVPAGTAFLYIDDIIVVGCSEKHHLNNLKTVFQTLRKFNLKINPYKCKFFRKEVVFLGHRCTENGILPDNYKLNALNNYPEPHDKEAVKRFVAFANYYRKFIRNFAILAKPLNHLTKKSTNFRWGEAARNAFTAIKNALTNPEILAYPDFEKPFIITSDACLDGCGAVLSQIQEDGTEKPISFASRAFNKSERNKPIIELELLGIYYAICYFKPYVYGTEFMVKTDHKPLIYLFTLTNPTQRLLRIRLELEEYSFNIEYIKGKDNVVADALSRIHFDEIKQHHQSKKAINVTTRAMIKKQNEMEKTKQNNKTKGEQTHMNVYEQTSLSTEKKIPKLIVKNMKLEARTVKKLHFSIDLTTLIRDGKLSLGKLFPLLQEKANGANVKKLQLEINSKIFNYCSIEEFKQVGNTMTNVSIILTSAITRIHDEHEKSELIKRYHEDKMSGGHCGRNRLYAKLRSKFFWKGMSKDVANAVKTCPQCQLSKTHIHTKEKMRITRTPQRPFDTVIIDTVGPLTKSSYGNVYAITVICDLTKYLQIIPVKNKESATVAKALVENVFLTYGICKTIRTDLGTEYKNQIFSEMTKLLDITHDFSTPYHHESLGTIERNHRVLNAYLRSYLIENRDDWDVYAKYFTFCYNTTPNSALSHKFSPFELVFGHEANMPTNKFEIIEPIYNVDNYVKELKFRLQTTHAKANQILNEYKQKMKIAYDKNSNELDVKVGDRIKIKNEAGHKLENIYRGPYTVIEVDDKNVKCTDTNNKTIIAHKNRCLIFN